MSTVRFKRKHYPPCINSKFPAQNHEIQYKGVFDNRSVLISETQTMDVIHNEGSFGKGSLSKSAPTYNSLKKDMPLILMQQQWENQLKWILKTNVNFNFESLTGRNSIAFNSIQDLLDYTFSKDKKNSWKMLKNSASNCSTNIRTESLSAKKINSGEDLWTAENDLVVDKHLSGMVENILKEKKVTMMNDEKYDQTVLVVDSTNNEWSESINFQSLKVTLKKHWQHLRETLKLDVPEAFFLCFALGCLKVFNKYGSEMNVNDLWNGLHKEHENFFERYIAYHHYRTHGWTVKSGLKFGGDYLLYKIGPAYFHASYLVCLLDKNKKMTWTEFVALNRLVETFNKDLILCRIIGADPITRNNLQNPNVLSEFSILEFATQRWVPTQEKDAKKTER